MIDAKVLQGAISRKKRPQLVLVDSNPCGFRLIDKINQKDWHYRDIDFIGVFNPSVTVNTLEKEIKFQQEIAKISEEAISYD